MLNIIGVGLKPTIKLKQLKITSQISKITFLFILGATDTMMMYLSMLFD